MGIDSDEVASFAPALQPDIGRLEYLYASSQRRLVIEMAAYTGDIAAAEDLVPASPSGRSWPDTTTQRLG